jgi:hypothetical protein
LKNSIFSQALLLFAATRFLVEATEMIFDLDEEAVGVLPLH